MAEHGLTAEGEQRAAQQRAAQQRAGAQRAAAPQGAPSERLASLPNLLTYGRILAIPALVACFFVTGDWGRWTAMWIFIAAGVSDFLDGYLARAWEQQSAIGRMLDPVADKLIVSAALMMLAADGTIAGWSLWAGVIILCREILVSGLREFLGTLSVSMPVTRLTKWKTVLQMVAIGFLLAGSAGDKIWPYTTQFGLTLLWIAAILTLYTGYDYLRAAFRHVTRDGS